MCPGKHATGPDGELLFPTAGEPQGFSTLATTQWDGSPEPVVRELLQNCLDAAKRAERPSCQVTIGIRNVPVRDIPGIGAYRRHFEAAVEERAQGTQGAAEKRTIQRIGRHLNRDQTPLLTCCDNGVGLDRENMARLLTEGNTDKANTGAGAFGLGHLTAFAASDLRYILYAGQRRNDNGTVERVSSGHAILASWAQKRRGAHGYWLRPAAQPSLFEPRPYPRSVPRILSDELARMNSKTGTVVCIVGFNNFRDAETPTEAIARVAAKNFLVAIHDQQMMVRIQGDATASQEARVDPERLDKLLFRARNEKRARRKGWFPGEQAYRCLKTLRGGETWRLKCGAHARLRRLRDSEGSASRVQLFRDGMWITNAADALTTGSFSGYEPFDALVMIDGTDSAIGRLVRDAEGPEHRGLDRRRLRSGDKAKLLGLLRGIGDELRLRAGKLEETAEYVPDDFAIFGDRGGRSAEKVPVWRPRAIADAEVDVPNVTTSHPADGEQPIDPTRHGHKRQGGRGARPAPGNRVKGRYSVRPIAGNEGAIDTLRVHWRPDKRRQASRPGALGVRVRIPSGSDATCELPIGPRWLPIREIRVDGEGYVPYDDGYEAPIPEGEIQFTVALATSTAKGRVIEVDIVRRIPRAGRS